MISRIALIAAAGLLLGAAMTPAMAADLGGGCCADLEERVAELEATTARKGNRVVSLQIYGTVAKGLLIWDDGEESDAYVVDNDAITSVLGFKGSAKFKPGWSTGFKVELAVTDATSGAVSQFDDEGNPGTLSIRESYVYIESERLGRVSLGQVLLPADGTAGVSIANTLYGSNADHSNNFDVLGSGAQVVDFANNFGPGRNDVIRYDSPSIYGFIASASWGDDDYWDVALRFAKEWNSFKVAAAIGYANIDPQNGDPEDNLGFASEFITGSISVMHVPTGLFVNFGTGNKELENSDGEGSFFFTQAGIERNWFGYGSTTLYGEYGLYEDQLTLHPDEGAFDSSEATRWGVGVVQHFDSAALDLYAQATFWEFEATDGDGDALDLEDVSTIMIGAKIDF